MPELIKVFLNSDIRIFLAFLIAMLITWYGIPVVVNAARVKKIYDVPNHRTSHNGMVPNLGGIALFAGISIPFMLFLQSDEMQIRTFLIAACIIIFFIGLKDDILSISPYKKMTGQVVASLIVILFGDLRLSNMHGFMGITDIPYIWSVLLTLVAIIGIVNSFNLVDGIDGLASGLGIIISLVFGIWFYMVEHYEMVVLSASLLGALIAFTRFNLFRSRSKIFMGDTGALLLGFIIAIMVISFNELNISNGFKHHVKAAPAVSFAFLMVPLFDTMRLMITRILRWKSPFMPDRNHFHHVMLRFGFSHMKSTFIIISVNIAFMVIALLLQDLGTIRLIILLFAIAVALSFLIYFLSVRKNTQNSLSIKAILRSISSDVASF